MRRIRPLLLALTLLMPLGAIASPVQLEVLTDTVPGFSFSWLHEASGCQSDGYWMCGDKEAITGSLSADQNGLAFTNITGNFLISGVQHAVSGSLDFGVAQGASLGSLTVGNFGSFDFVNQILSGPANSFQGDTIALWGQNFAPTPFAPQDGKGIDLGLKVTPGVPEPTGAAVFAIGALLVRAGARRKRA